MLVYAVGRNLWVDMYPEGCLVYADFGLPNSAYSNHHLCVCVCVCLCMYHLVQDRVFNVLISYVAIYVHGSPICACYELGLYGMYAQFGGHIFDCTYLAITGEINVEVGCIMVYICKGVRFICV